MNKGYLLKMLLIALMLGIASSAETAIRLAVIDLESIGDDPYIGRALAEIIRTELIKMGKYEVVERALLDKVLGEYKLQLSDLVDPEKAVEVGKAAGADYLLLGSVVKIGSNYTINARFIELETVTAKKAESIRGYSRDELTDMSIRLIAMLEGMIRPTPIPPPPPPSLGGRNYLSISLGGSAFSMDNVNDTIELVNNTYMGDVNSIGSGPDIEIGFARMVTEKVGVGFGLGYLGGFASGKLYSSDVWGNIIQISEDLEVSGVFLSIRSFLRQKLDDNTALCLGAAVGGISLEYSESTKPLGKSEGSGSGPLFGVFGSGQFLIENFFLQGEVGFRSAKGEVEIEAGFVTAELEIDFSGPYLLLTGGLRF